MTFEEFSREYPVQTRMPVIWGDMDAFQHVNNTVYFRYFEIVRMVYFEQTGINQWMIEHQVGPILGSTECRFLLPLTYPDDISIGTCVSNISERRFTMQYGVYSHKHEKLACKGSGEVVYYDYQAMRSCAIPDEIKLAIQKN